MVKKKVNKEKIIVNDINEELKKSFSIYRKNLDFMLCDVPIGVLCLTKEIENALLRQDCLRVYDLLDRDLTKIKGIGKIRGRYLAACLDEFLSVSC